MEAMQGNHEDVRAAVRPTQEERTWAMFAHLGGPIGMFTSAGTLSFVVPLVVWLAKRDESAFAADQGKQALNFHLTMLLVKLGCGLATVAVVVMTLGLGIVLVLPLLMMLLVLGAVEFVLGLVGALRAHDGVRYRYPFSVGFF